MVKVWDLPASCLCRKHLIAEHHEVHVIWSVIINDLKGFSRHPETLRWKGKMKALFNVHEELVKEMEKRGYKHKTPLDKKYATGSAMQEVFLESPKRQKEILKLRGCDCKTKIKL